MYETQGFFLFAAFNRDKKMRMGGERWSFVVEEEEV
jgi:hypothetical protein